MIDVTKGWDYCLVHYDGGTIPLHKPAQARAWLDALHEALEHLEEVERREGARLDRGAARAVNISFASEHTAWPGGTLPSAFTTASQPEAKVVQIEACECSRWKVCDGHVQGGDVA